MTTEEALKAIAYEVAGIQRQQRYNWQKKLSPKFKQLCDEFGIEIYEGQTQETKQ